MTTRKKPVRNSVGSGGDTYTYRSGRKLPLNKKPDEFVVRTANPPVEALAARSATRVSPASTRVNVRPEELEVRMAESRLIAPTHHAYEFDRYQFRVPDHRPRPASTQARDEPGADRRTRREVLPHPAGSLQRPGVPVPADRPHRHEPGEAGGRADRGRGHRRDRRERPQPARDAQAVRAADRHPLPARPGTCTSAMPHADSIRDRRSRCEHAWQLLDGYRQSRRGHRGHRRRLPARPRRLQPRQVRRLGVLQGTRLVTHDRRRRRPRRICTRPAPTTARRAPASPPAKPTACSPSVPRPAAACYR